jgi:creatinine amidohydrolase
MFPDELESAFEQCPVAWLPYGLCEPHGPQNAVGMDAIRAHRCLIRAAESFGGIVAPPFYWHCHETGGSARWGERTIGDARPWLTAYPSWFFYKSLCYHLRAVDALGFRACVLFSGHSGPHRPDVPLVVEIMERHIAVRVGDIFGLGTDDITAFGDGDGQGGHAGRGETSVLWAVAPDCVDLSRLPDDDEPEPHFAMGSFVPASSRRAGERLVELAAADCVELARRLLDDYEGPRATPLSFVDVEDIWRDEVRPRLPEFKAMEEGEPPAEGSRWRHNFHIADPDQV